MFPFLLSRSTILMSAALAMALSVSAFPEHIQARHSNDVLSPAEDGNTRNVVTSPRILGFFGGVSSGVTSKKPESYSSPRLGVRDVEPDGVNSLAVNTPTPTVPVSPTLQYSSHNEKNLELEEQGVAAWSPRRHQPSPFGRKTTPSPIHFGAPPVTNRLEFGAATRALPLPTHVPSKSVLAHTAHPWGSNESPSTGAGSGAQALSSSRPLPILPKSTSDSFKLSSSPSTPGSLVSLKSASPIILPSRSASATGSSKHTNPLPSPPTYSNSVPVPPRQSGSASRSSTASPISTPSSKVLITQRGHNANSTSVTMRYQPLVVDLPSGDTSTPASSPPNQNDDSGIAAPSAIRPLPRVPPSSINFGLSLSGITNGSNSTSHSHMPLKRPRTSPSSFSGFSGLTSSSSSAFDPRSAFDNIPSSWASKPSGLSSSRPSSPPSRGTGMLRTTTGMHPRRPPSLKLPRSRSWSRTRRERSLDSYTRLSPVTPRTPPSSGGMTTPLSVSGGAIRSLTVGRYGYQGSHGARPLTKKPSVTPTIMGRQRERGDSLSARDMSAGSALGKPSHKTTVPSLTRNPSLRHVRPQCPSGPVVRTRSVKPTSSTSNGSSSPIRFNTSPKPASQSFSLPKVPVQSSDSITDADPSSVECLHIHPFLTTFGSDELIVSTESPIDSPLEFFVDGPETDVASTNRSPSPIEYALPPDNSELSDWHSANDEETTDDDLGGVSSSTSNSRGFAAGRRRTQLRSYRMDYRPQMQGRLAHDLDRERNFECHDIDATIQGLPKHARALPVPPKTAPREKKKGKEESKKWSFGDFTSMSSLSSPSTPGTRTSSPERKGRSRQPRRLAEAVSLALGSGTRENTTSQSRSGRGSVSGSSQPLLFGGLASISHTNGVRSGGGGDFPAECEVLDIRMPSFEGKDEPRSNRGSSPVPLDFRIPEFSSTHQADMKRSPVPHDSPRSESSRSDIHWVTKEGKQSGLRDSVPVESRLVFRSPLDDDYESEDMPFMWLSRDKPPENPTPFIPLPPQRSFYGDNQQPEVVEGSDFASSLKHKTLSREMFPAMVSSISAVGYAPLPPLSTLLVNPTKRGGKSDEMGRKQRTTSGPSRFNLSGGGSDTQTISTATSTVDPNADVLLMNLLRKGLDEADDDDIYCDEEPDFGGG